MKIVITDDSRSVHSFIEAMFSDANNLSLSHAYDGKELLDLIQQKIINDDDTCRYF